MRELVGEIGLRNDIPSITEGVDIGPEPTPFQQAQDLAAGAWGARRTWFLINGASQGNHTICLALAHGGDRVVVQRNVHSSVIDGLVLSGMRPSFAAPELDPELGIAHCLTPDALAAALDATPDAVAAMVVSPTYFGACADVAGLAEVAHERGVPLAVDEAWGAHLRFHPDLPPDALSCGADLVVSSTHKIVGSLTQAAMLHLGERRPDRRGGRRPLRQPGRNDQPQRPALAARSTPPAGWPRCTASGCSTRPWPGSPRPARRSGRSPGLDVLDDGMVGRAGIAGWDPLRLAIDVRGTGATGYRLAKIAFELDDAIDLELAAENLVVAIFGLGEPAALAGRAAGRGAARRGRPARRGRGGAAAGAAGAAAALGRAGDDAARGLPRPPGGRPLRRRPRAGSRPSRSPPTRPGSPTSCPASG